MKNKDAIVKNIQDKGYCLVEGFLDEEELSKVIKGADEYFPDVDGLNKDAIEKLQHAVPFPFSANTLNQIPFDKNILDIAELVLNSSEIRLTSSFIQAKYGTRYAKSFDQPLHNDAWNASSLVWPNLAPQYQRLYGILYLTDVDDRSAPTGVVDKAQALQLSLLSNDNWARYLEEDYPELYKKETLIQAAAGDLLLFTGDLIHRGTAFRKEDGRRVAVFFNFHTASATWTGMHLWAGYPGREDWPSFAEFVESLSVRQREVLGFPKQGSDYWTDETRKGLQQLYPAIDVSVYK